MSLEGICNPASPYQISSLAFAHSLSAWNHSHSTRYLDVIVGIQERVLHKVQVWGGDAGKFRRRTNASWGRQRLRRVVSGARDKIEASILALACNQMINKMSLTLVPPQEVGNTYGYRRSTYQSGTARQSVWICIQAMGQARLSIVELPDIIF